LQRKSDVELDDIWLYIALQSGSIEIADKIVDSITDCFVALGRSPHIGRRRDEDLASGLPSFPVGNYVIIYCIEGRGDTSRLPLSSPVRNARVPAGFVVEPSAGTRYGLYSSF